MVGSIRDLTPSGVRIRTALRVEPQDQIGLNFLLPTPHRLSLRAEVRWVREEAPDRWLIGAKLAHTSETLKKMQLMLQDVQTGKLGVTRTSSQTGRIPKA